MSQVKLDAATVAALKAAGPEVELVGPDGDVIGTAVLPSGYEDLYDDGDEPTLEELQALDTGEGIPHEEVVRRLGLEP